MSKKNITVSRIGGLILILLNALACGSLATAQTLSNLVNFNGSNGALPVYGSLIADANGNLFGTTNFGGLYGFGTVFEILKTSGGYASTPTILVSFNNTNGAYPLAGLIADASGNLFSTTFGGGTYGYGTVFEIVNTNGVYASAPTTLVSFNLNVDGGYPFAGLIADASGNLFSTTFSGGTYGYGTVFEIANTRGVYASTPTTLVSFNNTNGAYPIANLIADANGNIFGTTHEGGSYGYGTVFEIVNTKGVYASTPTTLVSFNNTDGAYPAAGLIVDSNGNLFGTANQGGAFGYGTVFKILNTGGVYSSAPTTLVSFNNTDGASPNAGLIADPNGNLFSTTTKGGASGVGTVFEIVNTGGTYANMPTTLATFNSNNGAYPIAGLIADANGNLFGTTDVGGTSLNGTVFEITGSGFVLSTQFAGTPGNANCTDTSISILTHAYGGIAHAAPALGYASVAALQSAVATYCGN